MNQGTNHSLKMSDEVAAGIGGGGAFQLDQRTITTCAQ
jgi:hypothetical protein